MVEADSNQDQPLLYKYTFKRRAEPIRAARGHAATPVRITPTRPALPSPARLGGLHDGEVHSLCREVKEKLDSDTYHAARVKAPRYNVSSAIKSKRRHITQERVGCMKDVMCTLSPTKSPLSEMIGRSSAAITSNRRGTQSFSVLPHQTSQSSCR